MSGSAPRIPITVPCVGEEESLAAAAVVRSGWLTQGPKVAEFELAFAQYCGTQHAIALSNCTTALHLALVVLGIGPGDEVICPSMSYIATANSIVHAGATPVFADVDPRTFNLDPDAAEAAITPRTKAIMPVHQIGMPADIDRFLALGDKYGLKIYEDCTAQSAAATRDAPSVATPNSPASASTREKSLPPATVASSLPTTAPTQLD